MLGYPTGAITKDKKFGAVVVDQAQCIGCHSCAMACPFGVPRYERDEKMQKCNLCIERVGAGLDPACVRVCPMGALKFDFVNKIQGQKEFKYVGTIVNIVYRASSGK